MKLTYLAVFGVTILSNFPAHSEEAKQPQPPKWQVDNENMLCGTWKNTNPETISIPKVEISRKGAILMIRFWGKTHPKDTPSGPPEPLYVLSDHSEAENRLQKQPDAVAFATHKADFAISHFTLRLSEGRLSAEQVTLFTDDSKRSNRIMVETFKKEKNDADSR